MTKQKEVEFSSWNWGACSRVELAGDDTGAEDDWASALVLRPSD